MYPNYMEKIDTNIRKNQDIKVRFKDYILVFWLIMLSGVWSIKLPEPYNFIIICLVVVIMSSEYIYNKKKFAVSKKISYLVISITFIIISMFLNSDLLSLLTYIKIIFYMLIGYLIAKKYSYEKFNWIYVNIIKYISIISLVCFVFQNSILKFSYLFPIIKGQSASYINYYIYLYGIESPNRNTGIFWEPGAFAVFLGIALLFEINSTRKISYINIIVFYIALISTGSTLAFICIFACTGLILFNKKHKYIINIFMLFVFVSFIIFVMVKLGMFENIKEKIFLFSGSNASTKARNIGQFIDLKIVASNPFFGVGFNKYLEWTIYYGALMGIKWTVAANTFSYGAALFGLWYPGITIYGLLKLANKNNKSAFAQLIISFILIFIFIPQNFIDKPILYILLSYGYISNVYIIERKESL